MMFGAVLVIALTLVSIRNAFVSAVALEQAARCGAAEHHHSSVCYKDGRLCCGQTEHTHNRNCYLVLLKDNDINNLLSHIGNDSSRNLETLIYRAVDSAIQYNEDLYVADKMAAVGSDPAFQTVESTAPEPSGTSMKPSSLAPAAPNMGSGVT